MLGTIFFFYFIILTCGFEYRYEISDLDEIPIPCNPRVDGQCFTRNMALSQQIEEEFKLNEPSPYFHYNTCPEGIEYGQLGLQLKINKRYDNPSIMSKYYLLYGKVEADIMAAPGQGIILSIYLQSDDLDEIDIVEIFGGNPYSVQSNFFIKGNITTYDRGEYHPVNESPMGQFHRYGIEWTPNMMTWTLDNQVIRVVPKENPYGIPDSPMALKFSLWAGGDESNEPGTIEWAGGVSTYNDVPYIMRVKNVYMNDYSTGTEYCYGNSLKLNQWLDTTARNGVIASKLGNHAPGSDLDLSFLDDEEQVEYTYEYIDEIPASTKVKDAKPLQTKEHIKHKGKAGIKHKGTNREDMTKRFIQFYNSSRVLSSNESKGHDWSRAILLVFLFQVVMTVLF